MILIADAGSTKIEWTLLGNDRKVALRTVTRGHNAAQADVDSFLRLLHTDAPVLIEKAKGADEIFYYGAGCAGERATAMSRILSETFNAPRCHAESDMLGAARALCGREAGIACILGTGSNSCLYDGKEIKANIPPMGFILGDEGSGAVLGRRLLGMVMKGGFSAGIVRKFRERFPEATKEEIIARVYRHERPGAYLASFAPFLAENIGEDEISGFVIEEFIRFFEFNVKSYDTPLRDNAEIFGNPADTTSVPVSFIGSIAQHFAPQLHKAASLCGYTINRIEKSPMEALIEFHRGK